MVFIKTTMLLTIMFLFCTFNVHASEAEKSIVPSESGRLMQLGANDIDPKVLECFNSVEETLIKFQKEFQEEMEKNPKAKPSKQNTGELFGIIEEALKCMKENATPEQQRSIDQLLEVEADLEKLMKELDDCVEDAEEGAEGDACTEEGERVNEKMLEFVERTMTVMLDFMSDGEKKFAFRFAAFGLRFQRVSKPYKKFVKEVADFAFDVVSVNVKFFATVIKEVVTCTWDTVKEMYGCIKNYWRRKEKEEEDNEVFYDCEEELKVVFKDDKVLYYDAETYEQDASLEPVKTETKDDLAVKMLAREIMQELKDKFEGKEKPSFEEIMRETDVISKKLAEKYPELSEEQYKWLLSFAFADYYKTKPSPSPAYESIKELKDDQLKALLEQIFYQSEAYKKRIDRANEQGKKVMNDMEEELKTKDVSEQERKIIEETLKEFKAADGNVETLMQNVQNKMEEMMLKMSL